MRANSLESALRGQPRPALRDALTRSEHVLHSGDLHMKITFGVPVSTVPIQDSKPDLRMLGKDIHEVLTGTGSYGYKQRARKQTVKIEPEQNYGPSEVAANLNVSYDAASRLMEKMNGVVDFGTPTRRYKRGKKLRISGKNLLKYIKSKTRD
jgi:hypothetical protein